MKRIKLLRIVLIAAMALWLWSGAALAQELPKDFKTKSPEERAQYQTNLMKSELKLDSAQLAKAHAINLKYSHKFTPILKSNDSKISRAWKARGIQKDKDAELKLIFTKAQFKAYDKLEGSMISKLKQIFSD